MQLDDVIGQAQAVTSSLGEQRRIFENIGGKLVSVSAKFPMVNGVMNAIRRKKNKVLRHCTAPFPDHRLSENIKPKTWDHLACIEPWEFCPQ